MLLLTFRAEIELEPVLVGREVRGQSIVVVEAAGCVAGATKHVIVAAVAEFQLELWMNVQLRWIEFFDIVGCVGNFTLGAVKHLSVEGHNCARADMHMELVVTR